MNLVELYEQVPVERHGDIKIGDWRLEIEDSFIPQSAIRNPQCK